MSVYKLTDEIDVLPSVKNILKKKFNTLKIYTIKDLIYHFPTRYVDTSKLYSIPKFISEGTGTLMLEITSTKLFFTPQKRMAIFEATGNDGENFINIRWFNQRFLANAIKKGKKYLFFGNLAINQKQYYLSNPEFEEIKSNNIDDLVHLGRITPIYPETKGLSSKRIRSLLKKIEPYIESMITETIDKKIVKNQNLISLKEAILFIHFPKCLEEIEKARERLAFEELYNIQIDIKHIKSQQEKYSSYKFKPIKGINDLIKILPYKLTLPQQKAIEEIIQDISKPIPMHRLLTGDVGSGKTVVALSAMITVLENGYNVLFMCPTTILAKQHVETLRKFLPGHQNQIVSITSSNKLISPNKKPTIYVGTHAILHTNNLPDKIGLTVIDEQHRFGVKQRGAIAYIKDSNGNVPHYLIMSATPIPRTLALALYGNLDISYINKMPSGRIPIKTYYCTEEKREKVYRWILNKINKGHIEKDIQQLFVICPLIEDSEILQSKAAISVYDNLSKNVFPQLNVGLIHGKMKDLEKHNILEKYAKGDLDILVATPVIEVGIDIPNATMMIIENAERFGLAQLHQLRGRIGRRNKKSYCFVFSSSTSNDVSQRLEYFSKNTDGLKVAEYDLKHRGPGEVYGIKQAGIPELKIASIYDSEMMKRARDAAFKFN